MAKYTINEDCSGHGLSVILNTDGYSITIRQDHGKDSLESVELTIEGVDLGGDVLKAIANAFETLGNLVDMDFIEEDCEYEEDEEGDE